MDKFEWKATESAPANFPMQIVRGSLLFPDGQSLYIPDRKVIDGGWGKMVSSHIVGDDYKPLPNHLEIVFFSYPEDKFYRGSFPLPDEKMKALFEEGYYSPKHKQDITYTRIMTGVAPGGAVAVWLFGTDRITEVFFDYAEETDEPWSSILDNPAIERKKFVDRVLDESADPGMREAIALNGLPLGQWEKYRIRYHWAPRMHSTRPPGLITDIVYFNGEKDYLNYPLEETIAAETRAVPREMTLVWEDEEGKRFGLKLGFDEEEIFQVFEKLAQASTSSGPNGALWMEFEFADTTSMLLQSISISNAEESIRLTNVRPL